MLNALIGISCIVAFLEIVYRVYAALLAMWTNHEFMDGWFW